MIHVCFALYDKTGRYSKFTGTTMLSIFENTKSEVTVHILCDNTISDENRDKLTYVAEQYKQHVKFYNVEELCADKIAEIIELVPAIERSRFSIATFYRFLIPAVFPTDLDKIIYLDSDIIVNLNLNELWQIDLGDKPLAAVVESDNGVGSQTWFNLCRDGIVKADDYFNAGVMLMNLNAFRAEDNTVRKGLKFISEDSRRAQFFDQDALNYCFSTRFLKLPRKFNRFTRWAQGEPIGKRIYHYTVHYLQMDMHDPFNRLWMEYFAKTPWFDIEIIGRLYDGILQMFTNLRASMIKLTAVMSGKARVFVMRKNDVDSIKQIFSVRDDEEVIIADKYIPRQEVFESMNASRGKKFFFIFMPDFPFVNFEKMGFVKGTDFVDGFTFLPEVYGIPLDSHRLLKAM